MSTRHQPQQCVLTSCGKRSAVPAALPLCHTTKHTLLLHGAANPGCRISTCAGNPGTAPCAQLSPRFSAAAPGPALLPPGAEEPQPRCLCWLLLGEERQIPTRRFSCGKPTLGAPHPQGSSWNLPHLLPRAVFLPQDTPHHPMSFWLPDLLLLCQSFCILS